MTFKVGDKVRLTARGVEYVETFVCSDDEERWDSSMEGVVELLWLFVNVRLPIRYRGGEVNEDTDVWPLLVDDIELIEP